MLKRSEFEEREVKFLAPYAMKSRDTLGRRYPEPEHPYRSVYQRDKDRVVYSTAFRRLEYKTQVFVNYEGDHYRTRLTHTLEVAQLARAIARALRLNEDLVEVIALAHDLGHTPFGHAGEEVLHELMTDHGGFEHNRHGLRVVDHLEKRYPNFPGLNLTWETREGIIKHTTTYDQPHFDEFKPEVSPTLEAQVIDVADEVAYDTHDLDDGLRADLIEAEDLMAVDIWREVYSKTTNDYPDLEPQRQRYQIIKLLIDQQATDIIQTSERKLKELNINSVEDVRKAPERIISFSPEILEKKKGLKRYLQENLYQNYRVNRMSDKARRFIRELFNVYLEKPGQLPPHNQEMLKGEELHKVICDYIAGMTDRYALDEYKKLFEPYERV